MKEQKTILVMTVIILLMVIVLVGTTFLYGHPLGENIIGSTVSVLSIAVSLVIGYQIINAIEIKDEIKEQNNKIAKQSEWLNSVVEDKMAEVNNRMEEIEKSILIQQESNSSQMRSMVRLRIAINQLLARKSIDNPHEYWQGMSYQVDAISTALSFGMIEAADLCKEQFEYALCAYSNVWESDNSAYYKKVDELRNVVESSDNKPFVFLIEIVKEALQLSYNTYVLEMKEMDTSNRSDLAKKFEDTLNIVKTGWRMLPS